MGEEEVDPVGLASDVDLLSKMSEENERLKREMIALKELHHKEKSNLEAQVQNERSVAELEAQSVRSKVQDLEKMKMQMVQLTRKLDDEVSAKDQVISETHRLERKLQELSLGATTATSSSAASQEVNMRERTSQVSMKLMRVVDQWMKYKDLQQALLRNAAINDVAFGTLAQALVDCPSLQTLDLSQNLLTMDSCSDLCQLITTAPSLSFISLAENLFSLRCVGYFMTAVMERQTTKRLVPLDLLDLQGNEGLQMALAAVPPQDLVTKLRETAKAPTANVLSTTAAVELAAHVMRALWRFLHETQHPQLRGASADDVDFESFDKATLHKMDNALLKILLLAADENREHSRPLTANAVLLPATVRQAASASPEGRRFSGKEETSLPKEEKSEKVASKTKAKMTRAGSQAKSQREEQKSDPFADLKTAFEPVKEKAKTFNLKQIVTRTGTVLMNMLERLLETTDIDAVDVESDMTLLEFACTTGNLGLAKLCYRRGAKMMAVSKRGDTAFNIVTRNKRYDIMEFLHIYGVKINSADANGRTALHVAAENNDVDGICRLIEWGADVNIADQRKRTPIHLAAAGGHTQATMLLLEVGADMNAKDVKEYTAMAHAEANNHFNLMDRLVALGAKGHGLHHSGLGTSKSTTSLHGGTALAVPAGMLKSTSLGRIGKVVVHGMPGPIVPQLLKG